MKKHVRVVMVAAVLGLSAGGANAASVTSMTVTDGSFSLGLFTGGFLPFAGIGSDNDLAVYSTFSSNNTLQPMDSICATGSIACLNLGGSQLNAFLAPGSNQLSDGLGRPNLFNQAFNEVNGASTVDLTGFYANWGATDFNQGNAAVAVTTSNCLGLMCDYTASWSSLIIGGPLDGNIGSWEIAGTVSSASVVPVPAAVWLMGSGLIGLVCVARRRKTKPTNSLLAHV